MSVITTTTLTCPKCGSAQRTDMSIDACHFFHECVHCHSVLRPQPGVIASFAPTLMSNAPRSKQMFRKRLMSIDHYSVGRMSGRNIAAILLGLVVFLVACGGKSPTDTAEPLPTSTPGQTQPTSEGPALFIAKGCAACHGQNAEGSQIAPALPGHPEEMVKRQVRNPRCQMPAFSESQNPRSAMKSWKP